MKHALTPTYAAAAAPGSRLARLARRGLAVCVLACAGIGVAQAQYHGRRDEGQFQPPPSPRAERMPQMEGPRDRMADQQRFYEQQRMAEEHRRAAQMQQDAPRERRGRLTPDERRDLRRQINEAGMDIYPNAQRR